MSAFDQSRVSKTDPLLWEGMPTPIFGDHGWPTNHSQYCCCGYCDPQEFSLAMQEIEETAKYEAAYNKVVTLVAKYDRTR